MTGSAGTIGCTVWVVGDRDGEAAMGSNRVLEALEHFTLPQLLTDPGLCRNVLNDLGAPPGEVFLLMAALDAAVPQELMAHNDTNEMSMVEPRLIDDLRQRGVEQARAAWAVATWKEAVARSSVGRATAMPPTEPNADTPATEPATVIRATELNTVMRSTEPNTVMRSTEPNQVAESVGQQRRTPPARRGWRSRKALVAGVAVVLIAGGIVAWLASSHGNDSPSAAAGKPSAGCVTATNSVSSTSCARTTSARTQTSSGSTVTSESIAPLSGEERALVAKLPKALGASDCVSNPKEETIAQVAITCRPAQDGAQIPPDLFVYGFSDIPARSTYEVGNQFRSLERGQCAQPKNLRSTWRYNNNGAPIGDPGIQVEGANGGLFCYKFNSSERWIAWDYVNPPVAILIKAGSSTMGKAQLYAWWSRHASTR